MWKGESGASRRHHSPRLSLSAPRHIFHVGQQALISACSQLLEDPPPMCCSRRGGEKLSQSKEFVLTVLFFPLLIRSHFPTLHPSRCAPRGAILQSQVKAILKG